MFVRGAQGGGRGEGRTGDVVVMGAVRVAALALPGVGVDAFGVALVVVGVEDAGAVAGVGFAHCGGFVGGGGGCEVGRCCAELGRMRFLGGWGSVYMRERGCDVTV